MVGQLYFHVIPYDSVAHVWHSQHRGLSLLKFGQEKKAESWYFIHSHTKAVFYCFFLVRWRRRKLREIIMLNWCATLEENAVLNEYLHSLWRMYKKLTGTFLGHQFFQHLILFHFHCEMAFFLPFSIFSSFSFFNSLILYLSYFKRVEKNDPFRHTLRSFSLLTFSVNTNVFDK